MKNLNLKTVLCQEKKCVCRKMKPCGVCYPDVCYLVDKMTLFSIEDSLSGDCFVFCLLMLSRHHKSLAPMLDCAESS